MRWHGQILKWASVTTKIVPHDRNVLRMTSCSLGRIFISKRSIGCSAVQKCPSDRVPLVNVAHVTTHDIKKFLNLEGISFEDGHTCFIVDCKFCHSHGRGIGKLHINMTTGMFLCPTCKSYGSWLDLQDQLLLAKKGDKIHLSTNKITNLLPNEKDLEPMVTSYRESIALGTLSEEKLVNLLKKFDIEGLRSPILDKYGARMKEDESQLLLPIHMFDGSVAGFYVMRLAKGEHATSKPKAQVFPRCQSSTLFGMKQLSKRQESVILTATPIDALAVAQELTTPVVSLLPDRTLPLEVLPLLEPYNKIILWFGNDLASWELSKVFAAKLNEERCHIIRPEESSPNPMKALSQNFKLLTVSKSAHPVAHKAITTFHSLRQQVLSEFSHVEQVAGVKWKRYPLLTKILRGHRRGELTIFTGSTGSGKTTFISDYSLDLCIQGVRTLWGSFEIRNTRLAKMMLTQFSELPLEKQLDQFDHWANEFEKLPLYFLTFHGSQSIRSVMDAMRHAVYVHDIEHVIVDNLQFMLGMSESSRVGDRYWQQDLVVSSFRQFATVHNCHVTLVIHPRKEDSDVLSNMSIFGGAKAIQEADNILILQDKRLNAIRGRKYIQVTKNRFNGELGVVPLEFDRETLSFMLKKKNRKNLKKPSSKTEIIEIGEVNDKDLDDDI